jgi:clorobiocin biosynthesis protein CloN4
MMEHGGLLHEAPPALRTLLFAGEPFPMKELRRLRKAWPAVPMWNLYGPTETNVCTAYPVKSIDPEASSIPIGHAVSGDRVWVRRDDGTEANVGEEGELVVVGPTVFPGYWGQPRRTEEAYGTGDRVVLAADGELRYCGRRDHMVKVRGHRVELGDVEAAVLQHASVRNAAAFVRSEGLAARLVVCLAVGSERPPTLLEMKRFCAERLPRSMIPDEVIAMPELPRNRNGKIDRQALAAAAQPDASAT